MSAFPGKHAYLLLLMVAALDGILLVSLPGIGISPDQLLRMLALPMASLLALAFIERYRSGRQHEGGASATPLLDRLVVLVRGIVFLQLGWIALRLFNHLTMALGFPYVDEALIAADRLIGLNWPAYFEFVVTTPALLDLMALSYQSLTPVSALAFLLLIGLGEIRRSRFFLQTFLVTAVVCSAIGFLFPAEAAVMAFIGGPEMFPGMENPPGLYHMEHLERLRSGLPVVLDLDDLPGLVTIPSFHTAAGVILICSFRRTALFIPVALYSLVMIASTPVLGGHYFVDLIAGTLVALAVAVPFQRSAAYRDLFEPRPAAATGALPETTALRRTTPGREPT